MCPAGCSPKAEAVELAEKLLGGTVAKQEVARDQLTIHAHRGASMASKPVAALADLGVTKSHSRPCCSNDNPYSESQFKTLNTARPSLIGSGRSKTPERSPDSSSPTTTPSTATPGIGLLTPADVHYGHAAQVHAARQDTLDRAYAAHPNRFVRKPPAPPALPEPAWINQPETD